MCTNGKKGESLREIGQIVKRTHSSAQRVVDNFKETGVLVSKPSPDRPHKLTDREKRVIVQSIKENPLLTSSKIAQKLNVQFQKTMSTDTVRIAWKKPFVSQFNRQKRIAFTKKYVSKPLEFWNKILFF